jgi:hypothetical protein
MKGPDSSGPSLLHKNHISGELVGPPGLEPGTNEL